MSSISKHGTARMALNSSYTWYCRNGQNGYAEPRQAKRQADRCILKATISCNACMSLQNFRHMHSQEQTDKRCTGAAHGHRNTDQMMRPALPLRHWALSPACCCALLQSPLRGLNCCFLSGQHLQVHSSQRQHPPCHTNPHSQAAARSSQ